MTTWTSKGSIAALVLLALSACEGGQGAALFEGLSLPGTASKEVKPLSQAAMADGAVTLVAPSGFCIDGKSVKKQFALMARCDVLGAPHAAADAPVGFITVSLFPATPDSALPDMQDLVAANGLTNATDAKVSKGQLVFRAEGTAPIDGASNRHWRGTARTGSHVISVALFGPEGGRAVSGEGRSIVSAVMSRSQGES